MSIPFKAAFYGQVFSFTFLITSITGMYTYLRKDPNITTIYMILVIFLMNFQMMLSLDIPILVDKATDYGDKRWGELDKNQRVFVQNSMMCCGYYDINDRSEGECDYSRGCSKVIKKMAISIRNRMIVGWVLLFVIESLSISILLLLRIRTRSTKKRK